MTMKTEPPRTFEPPWSALPPPAARHDAIAGGDVLPDCLSPAQAVRIGLAEPRGGGLGPLYYLTLGQFVRAFATGKLPIPPVPPPGQEYQPVYRTSRELRDAIGSELPRGRLGRLLREHFHLSPRAGGQGYELLEVYEAVAGVYVLWRGLCGPERRR